MVAFIVLGGNFLNGGKNILFFIFFYREQMYIVQRVLYRWEYISIENMQYINWKAYFNFIGEFCTVQSHPHYNLSAAEV